MSLLNDKAEWEPELISVFQFVALFRGKHINPFVENLAHEGALPNLFFLHFLTVPCIFHQYSKCDIYRGRLSAVFVIIVVICLTAVLEDTICIVEVASTYQTTSANYLIHL